MPMAYASLLGGLTTLIGTPPNLVASTALRQAGHEGFALFEFAPIGVPALIVGTLFVAFVGRHLLPSKMPRGDRRTGAARARLQFSYDLDERRFRLRVAAGSPLHGLHPRRDRSSPPALGLHVLSIRRADRDITEITLGDDHPRVRRHPHRPGPARGLPRTPRTGRRSKWRAARRSSPGPHFAEKSR